MLILNPRSVVFGTVTWENVRAVAVTRRAHKEVVEWGDAGPHVVLVDVPEQRVEIEVVIELARDDLASPKPGEQAVLSLHTSASASDAFRKKLSATCVVTRVEHEVSLKGGATRRVLLTCVSSDGTVDPVSVTEPATATSEAPPR